MFSKSKSFLPFTNISYILIYFLIFVLWNINLLCCLYDILILFCCCFFFFGFWFLFQRIFHFHFRSSFFLFFFLFLLLKTFYFSKEYDIQCSSVLNMIVSAFAWWFEWLVAWMCGTWSSVTNAGAAAGELTGWWWCWLWLLMLNVFAFFCISKKKKEKKHTKNKIGSAQGFYSNFFFFCVLLNENEYEIFKKGPYFWNSSLNWTAAMHQLTCNFVFFFFLIFSYFFLIITPKE